MAISPRLLFLSFLGFGLITGLFIGSLGLAIAAPAERSEQHNVLFVLVDDLTAENPSLEGIWLAAQSEADETWNWMPIYPEPLEDVESEFSKPHAAFYLPNADFDNAAALPPLRGQGAWWDEEFWLDEIGLNQVLAGSGMEASSFARSWQEPQKALFQQVQVLNQLCNLSMSASNVTLLDQLVSLMPTHLRSTSGAFDLIRSWDTWIADGGRLACAHPWAN